MDSADGVHEQRRAAALTGGRAHLLVVEQHDQLHVRISGQVATRVDHCP